MGFVCSDPSNVFRVFRRGHQPDRQLPPHLAKAHRGLGLFKEKGVANISKK